MQRNVVLFRIATPQILAGIGGIGRWGVCDPIWNREKGYIILIIFCRGLQENNDPGECGNIDMTFNLITEKQVELQWGSIELEMH